MKSMMAPLLILMALIVGSVVYVSQGIAMHQRVAVEEAKFHALQNTYFTISKIDRDAAPTGSELNQQLVQVQNYPSELLRLKLVGVGRFRTATWLTLVAIAFLLFMMPLRLGKMMMVNG